MKRTSTAFLLLLLIMGCATGDSDLIDYQTLHRNALVVDLHSDAVLRMLEGADFGIRDTTGHMDLPRLREGGVNLQVMACWLDTQTPVEECRPHVDKTIDSLEAQLVRYPDQMSLCVTAAEVEKIVAEERVAIFIGIENGVAIANDLDNIDHFYNRGVRYLTLTHTASNDWCISSADTLPAFDGLTDFGRDVVRRMNDLGMIVDISHASPGAVEEVLAVTTDPVIASHSCVHALCQHDRNLTDEQIKAIAANGGVIGINFFNVYLSEAWKHLVDSLYDSHRPAIDSIRAQYSEDRQARREAFGPIRQAVNGALDTLGSVDVGTVCDHIDYIVQLVGADYVALGSDFDGVSMLPKGLTDCSMVPNITKELVERGYTEQDIRKILGENFIRVFAAVCD